MRYFLLKDENTLSVYLSEDLQTQPINSLPFEPNNLINARFDQYPNPTKLIEGEPLPIEVPPTISQMNLRLQLIAENIPIASVYDTIEQIPDAITKETIYTKWEYALIFERADQTLNQMAQMLNVSQEQLDRIFINGNQN
jgi:hypothetical protein